MGGEGGLSKRGTCRILRMAADPFASMSLRARVHSKTCFLLRRKLCKRQDERSFASSWTISASGRRRKRGHRASYRLLASCTKGATTATMFSHLKPKTKSPTSHRQPTPNLAIPLHVRDPPSPHSEDEEVQLPNHAAAMSTPCSRRQQSRSG